MVLWWPSPSRKSPSCLPLSSPLFPPCSSLSAACLLPHWHLGVQPPLFFSTDPLLIFGLSWPPLSLPLRLTSVLSFLSHIFSHSLGISPLSCLLSTPPLNSLLSIFANGQSSTDGHFLCLFSLIQLCAHSPAISKPHHQPPAPLHGIK